MLESNNNNNALLINKENQSISNNALPSSTVMIKKSDDDLPTLRGTLLKRNDSDQWSKRICETHGPFLGLLNTKNKLVANLYCPTIQDIIIIGNVNDELGTGTLFNIKLKDDKNWMFRARSMNDAKKWKDHLILLSTVNENDINNNNIDPTLASKWTTSFSESKGNSVSRKADSTPLITIKPEIQSIPTISIDSPLPLPPSLNTTTSSAAATTTTTTTTTDNNNNNNNTNQQPASDILYKNIEKLVNDIDKANLQLENKIQENIKINKLYNILQHQVDDISMKLQTEIEAKELIKEQLDIKTNALNSYIMKDDELKKEVDNIKNELKVKEDELLILSKAYSALKIEIDDLHIIKKSDDKAKETLQCKLELKTKELSSCLIKLKALHSDLDKNKLELSQVIVHSNEYESNVSKLSQQNADLTKTSNELSQQNADLTKASTELSQQNADLTKASAELSQKNADLTKTSTELSQQNADLTKTSTELSQQNADLTKASAELSQKNADLTKTSTELSQQNADLTKKSNGLSQKNADLTKKSNELSQQNAELSQRTAELRVAKDQIDNQLDIAAGKIRLLEEIIHKQACLLKDVENEKLTAFSAQRICEEKLENEKNCREKLEKEKIIGDYEVKVIY